MRGPIEVSPDEATANASGKYFAFAVTQNKQLLLASRRSASAEEYVFANKAQVQDLMIGSKGSSREDGKFRTKRRTPCMYCREMKAFITTGSSLVITRSVPRRPSACGLILFSLKDCKYATLRLHLELHAQGDEITSVKNLHLDTS